MYERKPFSREDKSKILKAGVKSFMLRYPDARPGDVATQFNLTYDNARSIREKVVDEIEKSKKEAENELKKYAK